MSAKINKTHCKLLITWSLAVFCAFPITALAQMASGQKAPPPLGTLVDVGGYRIHLYCTGEGTPTVVIVGAGFSFDWGLVQPEAAKFTQVCAYDHSGIGWSDDGPKDSCSLIDLCINNAMVQDKKLERSDCRMQPRSFSREVRTLLIERMTSFINSSTFSGEPLASSRLARDQTPSSGLSSGA